MYQQTKASLKRGKVILIVLAVCTTLFITHRRIVPDQSLLPERPLSSNGNEASPPRSDSTAYLERSENQQSEESVENTSARDESPEREKPVQVPVDGDSVADEEEERTSTVKDKTNEEDPSGREVSAGDEEEESSGSPLTVEQVVHITYKNRNFAYLSKPKILFAAQPKGGTTSLFQYLYHAVSGEKWTENDCKSPPQELTADCWQPHARHVSTFSPDKQLEVFTSPDVLRVAIQRDPYERIISCFKSKFTCEDEKYGTDILNRPNLVRKLRKQAGFEPGEECMNMTEFANALDSCRRTAGKPGSKLEHVGKMDQHLRPQDYHYDKIDYDLIMYTNELGNLTIIKPIVDRLPYTEVAEAGPGRFHATKDEAVVVGAKERDMLQEFAKLAKLAEPKHP